MGERKLDLGDNPMHYIKKKIFSSRSRRHILKIASYYLIYLGKYWRASTLEEMKNIFGADFQKALDMIGGVLDMTLDTKSAYTYYTIFHPSTMVSSVHRMLR
jgi:hypothetical protein